PETVVLLPPPVVPSTPRCRGSTDFRLAGVLILTLAAPPISPSRAGLSSGATAKPRTCSIRDGVRRKTGRFGRAPTLPRNYHRLCRPSARDLKTHDLNIGDAVEFRRKHGAVNGRDL